MKKLRNTLLVILTAIAVAAACAEDNEATKKDMALLQGEWSIVTAGGGGQALPGDMLENSRRVCKGDETTVTIGGQLLMKANFTLHPTQKPKTIDYRVTAGRNAGKTQLGIYELDGDTVKFCFAAPGAARPTDFDAKGGDRQTASVWKRVKKEPSK
jgi:uncharacterized protein (TIGR03067 family)